MPIFKIATRKNDVIEGEPYTWRRISTVRGQANENLPLQGGKASSPEPTNRRQQENRGRQYGGQYI